MEELKYPFDSTYILKKKKSLKKSILNKKENLIELKIAILSGSTIGELKNILEIFLLNYGIKPVFWEGNYNRFYEDAVFGIEEIKIFNPNIVYIHTNNKNIEEFPEVFENDEETERKINKIYLKFYQVWEKIKENLSCSIIQNNFEMMPFRLLGNQDAVLKFGKLNFIKRINEKFYQYSRQNSSFYINDIEYQSACYGLDKWFDNKLWYMYKYAFSIDAIPIVANNIANIIKSIYGKNKKSLILDLDNTLWGGVIGDDGIDGIKIDMESSEGMIFKDFQEYIKNLSNMGIILNICSKNENEALKGFEKEFSVLKESDFLIKKVNWKNKDENIKEIANELNIGLDSFVFIDDNPMERDIVKQNLPQIETLNINLPEEYIRYLDRAGYFEVTAISEDDKKRNKYYTDNLNRNSEIKSYTDYKEYLKALNMKCEISEFNEKNIDRIVQLINKTNQFNLTTIRLNYDDVKEYINKNCISFCSKLIDKFGDNGIVSVIMANINNDIADIDLWIMSCRVFKRELEKTMFNVFIKKCIEKGVKFVIGHYIKTKKNNLVSDFYKDLGFKLIYKDDLLSDWIYEVPIKSDCLSNIMEVIEIGKE